MKIIIQQEEPEAGIQRAIDIWHRAEAGEDIEPEIHIGTALPIKSVTMTINVVTDDGTSDE